ncbi:MAG: hypothetical protein HZB83_07370, partial [Deltaproteobacteria bacterium]|nr:hypothetical protein [Deltaproteobacteria bacterium]
YKYNSAVTAELGISRFSAGSYIKDRVEATVNGQSANQDWAYLQIITNF